MTYDTAVWQPANDLSDPTAEFERRFEQSDARYPNYLTPELVRLADLLEPAFHWAESVGGPSRLC